LRYFFLFISLFSSLYSLDKSYEEGKKIYERTCASCHGINGIPNPEIKFIVSPRNLSKSILTEEQNYHIIKDGSHFWGSSADIMPAFKTLYNDYQMRSIAFYIKEAFNPNVDTKVKELYAISDSIPKEKQEKMLTHGKKIYMRNCSWCHGATGEGDGEATRHPELSIFPYNLKKALLTNEQMFLYAKYGGQFWGTHKDDMPSWSRKYDDYTLKSVIRYIDETFKQ